MAKFIMRLCKADLFLDEEVITIPEGTTIIGRDAFNSCYGLKEVFIPEGVETIEQSSFHGCSNLVTVHLPSTIKSIYGSAFADCISLTNMHVPESCLSVSDSAFYHLSKRVKPLTVYIEGMYTNVNVPSLLQWVNYVWIHPNSLADKSVVGCSNEILDRINYF